MSQIDSNLNKLSHFSQDNEESIVLTQLTFCSEGIIISLAKARGIHTFSSDVVILFQTTIECWHMYCVCMRGILREPTILFPIN